MVQALSPTLFLDDQGTTLSLTRNVKLVTAGDGFDHTTLFDVSGVPTTLRTDMGYGDLFCS